MDSLNGVRLAIEHINAQGGIDGRKLDLDLHDDKGDTATAAALMRKVTANDDVVAVLFSPRSPVMIALAKMAAQIPISLIGIGASSPWPGDFNDWTFRFSQVDSVVAAELIPKVNALLKPETLSVIYAYDDEWANSMANIVGDLSTKEGIKLTSKESFKTKDTDFRAQLTKIAQQKPDVLVVIGLENEASLIMRQARQLGVKTQFVGMSSFSSPKLLELAGEAAEGAMTGIAFMQDSERAQTQEFVKAYKDKYQQDVPANAAHGYDAVLALAQALKNAKGDYSRQSVRDQMAALEKVEGVTGTLTMKGKGDADRDVYVVQIRDGSYVEAK
ncbi:MAG: ABC transporter substrate-binding protein [Burkholderiaceae bacterium]